MIQLEVLTEITDCYNSFVKELYESTFPADERRNWDDLLTLCRSNPAHTFNLILKGEKPAGFLISWQLEDFVFMEHFAVDHHLRGRGIGKEVIRLWLSRQDSPVLLEVEPPVHADQKRRIVFYEQLGFRLHDVEYWQPPYSPDKHVLPMKLMSYGNLDVESRFAEIKRVLQSVVYGMENNELPL